MSSPAQSRAPARSDTGDPLLLTPGPLTTSKTVKQAMVHDWGSRDATFIALNAEVMESLLKIVHGEGGFVTVPMQGSGAFAVEAMLTTFAPRDGAVLVLVNGAYGQRAKRILAVAGGRATIVHETAEDTPPDLDAVERILAETPAITHVFAVHCETTSGILNPIEKIAALCARHGRRLLIDAMSAFGALELDSRATPFDAVAASANKCLEGVPGARLRRLPARSARRDRGQCDDAVARPARPALQSREDRAVPLHPADPCHRRLPPGATGILGRRRRRRPRRPLRRERAHPHRRHALARLRDAAARRADHHPRRRHAGAAAGAGPHFLGVDPGAKRPIPCIICIFLASRRRRSERAS
jgi:hypothetical protein